MTSSFEHPSWPQVDESNHCAGSSHRRGSGKAAARDDFAVAFTATRRTVGTSPSCRRATIREQASTFGWAAYVGPLGEVIGMKTFDASAPLKALQTKFGFTPERIVAAARATLARTRAGH